jgi:hypothetical protein
MTDAERNAGTQAPGIDGYLFRLIATFEAAAMQQLGKIAHPLTGDVEVDLDGASDSIEMLAAIQRKTEGNLNPDEKRLLDHVLYQLRMNYVDVAAEQGKEQPGGDGAGATEGTGGREAGEPEGDEPEGGKAGEGGDAAAGGGEEETV